MSPGIDRDYPELSRPQSPGSTGSPVAAENHRDHELPAEDEGSRLRGHGNSGKPARTLIGAWGWSPMRWDYAPARDPGELRPLLPREDGAGRCRVWEQEAGLHRTKSAGPCTSDVSLQKGL